MRKLISTFAILPLYFISSLAFSASPTTSNTADEAVGFKIFEPAIIAKMSDEQLANVVSGVRAMLADIARVQQFSSGKTSSTDSLENSPAIWTLLTPQAYAAEPLYCEILGHAQNYDVSSGCPPQEQLLKTLRVPAPGTCPRSDQRICEPLAYGPKVCGSTDEECNQNGQSEQDIAKYWKSHPAAFYQWVEKIKGTCDLDAPATPKCTTIQYHVAKINAVYKGNLTPAAPAAVPVVAQAGRTVDTKIDKVDTFQEVKVAPKNVVGLQSVNMGDVNLAPPAAPVMFPAKETSAFTKPAAKPVVVGELHPGGQPGSGCDPYRLGESVSLSNPAEMMKTTKPLLNFDQIQSLICGHMSAPADALEEAQKFLTKQKKIAAKNNYHGAKSDREWLTQAEKNLKACIKEADQMPSQKNWRDLLQSKPYTEIKPEEKRYDPKGVLYVFESTCNRNGVTSKCTVGTSRATLLNTMKIYDRDPKNPLICSSVITADPAATAPARATTPAGSVQ